LLAELLISFFFDLFEVAGLSEYEDVEKVLQLGGLKHFEARPPPHELGGELVHVLKPTQHFGDEELASLLQHSVGLLNKLGEVGSHERQAEDNNVHRLALESHVGYVALSNVLVLLTFELSRVE